jgi:hypothetical protein
MALESVSTFINNLCVDNDRSSIEVELKLLLDNRIKTPNFILNLESYGLSYILNLLTYSKSIGDLKVEQTINFIHTFASYNDGMYIKQLVFVDGVQNKLKKNYYIKKSMIQPIYMVSNTNTPSYKLGVCMETKTENNDNLEFNIVRFRNRNSIVFYDIPEWRLDITYVKESSMSDINILTKMKDDTFANKLCNMDWTNASKIEVEFEYIGHVNKFNISNILDIDSIINSAVQSTQFFKNINISKTYIDCICEIASILKPNILHKFQNGYFGLKQMGSNPIELTKKEYQLNIIPNINNFIITEKIDGIRSMILLYPSLGECYIINNKNKQGIYMIQINVDPNIDLVILDSEEINNIFYVFDILHMTGIVHTSNIYLHTMQFIERKAYMLQIINKYDFLYNKHYEELSLEHFHEQFEAFYNTAMELPYEIDGLIIFEKNKPYNTMLQYKWKPIMTIDFVAKKCPPSMLGINPYVIKENKILYLLFCGAKNTDLNKLGISLFKEYVHIFNNIDCNIFQNKQYVKDSYFPIQFAPSANPLAYLFWTDQTNLNGKIVELTRVKDNWKLIKIRTDRDADMKRKTYYGNYFKYAELIWMNLQSPLTMTELCNVTKRNTYFQEDSKVHIITRKFNNFVKLAIINQCTNQIKSPTYVIDLAAGKGQDLKKYIDCGFKKILMIDNDIDALTEVVNRKYIHIKNSHTMPSIYTCNIDLLKSYKVNIETIKNKGINVYSIPFIVCNLALHYLIPNKQKIQNFCNLINKLLNNKGIFTFTAFNAEKILNLLKNKKSWELLDPDTNKVIYSIKKSFTDASVNKKIKVLLPFSNNQYYTETLINTDLLNGCFEKKKIKLINCGSFIDLEPQFKKKKPHFYKQLTDIDREYISLYSWYVYQKD